MNASLKDEKKHSKKSPRQKSEFRLDQLPVKKSLPTQKSREGGGIRCPVVEKTKIRETDVASKLRNRQIRDLAFHLALERLLRRKVRSSKNVSCPMVSPSPFGKASGITECSDSSASESPTPATKKGLAVEQQKQSNADSEAASTETNLLYQENSGTSKKREDPVSQKEESAISELLRPVPTSAPLTSEVTALKDSSPEKNPDPARDPRPALNITTELSHHMEGLKVRCKSADMLVEMQEHALCCAKQAIASSEKLQLKRIASLLKKEFDQAYGPAWHCIAGTNFGSYVTHSVGGFFYFSIGKISILLFKTKVELIEL